MINIVIFKKYIYINLISIETRKKFLLDKVKIQQNMLKL